MEPSKHFYPISIGGQLQMLPFNKVSLLTARPGYTAHRLCSILSLHVLYSIFMRCVFSAERNFNAYQSFPILNEHTIIDFERELMEMSHCFDLSSADVTSVLTTA